MMRFMVLLLYVRGLNSYIIYNGKHCTAYKQELTLRVVYEVVYLNYSVKYTRCVCDNMIVSQNDIGYGMTLRCYRNIISWSSF